MLNIHAPAGRRPSRSIIFVRRFFPMPKAHIFGGVPPPSGTDDHIHILVVFLLFLYPVSGPGHDVWHGAKARKEDRRWPPHSYSHSSRIFAIFATYLKTGPRWKARTPPCKRGKSGETGKEHVCYHSGRYVIHQVFHIPIIRYSDRIFGILAPPKMASFSHRENTHGKYNFSK